MKKISPKGQRWLKGFHSLFACMWVGAAIVLIIKQFNLNPASGEELYGITATMDFIDLFIIIPGAFGVLLTGIIYSVWTNWGWFKNNWITVKWVICIYGIAFGTYPLGPWMTSLAEISKEEGLTAFSNPVFLHNQKMLMIFGTFQASTLIVAVFLSALKPWKKKEKSKTNN